MCFIKWIDSKVKKMNWLDLALTKLSVFLFTLLLFRIWPEFRSCVMSWNWYWYLILSLLVASPVLKKILS